MNNTILEKKKRVSDQVLYALIQLSSFLSIFILLVIIGYILYRGMPAFESGVVIHEPDSLEEYSGQFKLRIPKSLHRSLAEHSKKEGISMNQYCVYLLAKNDAVYSK